MLAHLVHNLRRILRYSCYNDRGKLSCGLLPFPFYGTRELCRRKRRKELEKQRKKEEKRQRKLTGAPDNEGEDEAAAAEAEGETPAADALPAE